MPNFNKVKLLSERSCGAPAVIFKRVQGVNIVKSVEYVKSAECVKYAKAANSASIVSAFLHFFCTIKLNFFISVREMFKMHSAFIYTDCLT